MLTSKAIHFRFCGFFWGGGGLVENFVSDLHRVWLPWQQCCAYNRNDGGKSCSYVLCSVSGEIEGRVFFRFDAHICRQDQWARYDFFSIFFIIIFIFYH